ncbi:MAG: spike glycoprotein [Tadarida brasiliensis bat alphacoronavirus 2]|nr:MAG: spike glycoprotein [Tadarida brasiliensis bat alphacoronavirus 2]
MRFVVLSCFFTLVTTFGLPFRPRRVARSNVGDCYPEINRHDNFKLGLPANATALVPGYLPLPDNWTCTSIRDKNYGPVPTPHGLFLTYYEGGDVMSFGIASHDKFNTPLSPWSLYYWQRNNGGGGSGQAHIRICSWPVRKGLALPTLVPNVNPPKACLYDVNLLLNAAFEHNSRLIFGVTWSGNRVTMHTPVGIKTYVIPGAEHWDVVTVFCAHGKSCAHQVVYTPITVNVTTDSDGRISSYSVCETCDGFPEHVFAVGEGGEIPPNFDFTNWFMLTNSTSVVQGRVVSKQPLRLLCLWPVPALQSTDTVVYFNGSAADRRCNGYAGDGVADALRFSLNFSSDNVLQGAGSIKLITIAGDYVFTCHNSTNKDDVAALNDSFIPFGSVKQAYYCFVRFPIGNDTKSQFVGVLPPVLREVVVDRFGNVYLNGYRFMSAPAVVAVNFSLTSLRVNDFWTVAFAVNADVLLEIEDTYIRQVLYCNNPLNAVKCQQMQFFLENGFYPYSNASDLQLPRTYVALPAHSNHMFVNVTADVSSRCPNGAGAVWCAQCRPCYYSVRIAGSLPSLDGDSVCVDTRQYTLVLQSNITSQWYCHRDVSANVSCNSTTQYCIPLDCTLMNPHVTLLSGSCPFTFEALNDYLAFESVCFSTTKQPGSCAMQLATVGYGVVQPFAEIYVSAKKGARVTGVPINRIPEDSVVDQSVVFYNVCTDYTIYGMSGRGKIVETNLQYRSGLFYASDAGTLLGYKNVTTGKVYGVLPCQLSKQVVVISDSIVGAMTASETDNFNFNYTLNTTMFYYHTDSERNCSEPVLTYSSMGICADGSIGKVELRQAVGKLASPLVSANLSIPVNFTLSVQAEYVQVSMKPVSVDCATYVCNGNPHCLQLLTQYASACKTIEDALRMSARLESVEVNNMLTVSEAALSLATIDEFNGGDYNFSSVLPKKAGGRSVIEDLLFDKVVTSGLGTVDADYKACVEGFKDAQTFKIMTHTCAQYYNGIMVVPGVADQDTMAQFTASLVGGLSFAFLTSAAAYPFGQVVQARLNYVALQTDVLQKNQQILAASFNSAMGNITAAFGEVNNMLQQTSEAIRTVAVALDKVQNVVNQQGQALSELTKQLAVNFDAISASIEDIYNRLDKLAADAQVDRLISGRLAALNAFVTQQLTKFTDVRASRLLAQEKVNECVKSQSKRYGFCGNGTHVFSLVNAAPDGLMFFHTVLVPTAYATVEAWAGVCVDDQAFVLREVGLTLFKNYNDTLLITARDMFEPRLPQRADFVQIASCDVSYLNMTRDEFDALLPEYIDVNKTLSELLQNITQNRPNLPDLPLDIYNGTFLNLTTQIRDLENRSATIEETARRLDLIIRDINGTLVDLEWLNRVETYIKWPWYIWLLIVLALIFTVALLLYCCLSTGCCGCFKCMKEFDLQGHQLKPFEFEKVHIQ